MGVGVEVANAEAGERGRREEGFESTREEGTTAAIHGGFTQQIRGEHIYTESDKKREAIPKGRWKYMEKELMIHREAGWRSPVVAR